MTDRNSTGSATSSTGQLDALLRSLWQGDLISFGAVAVVSAPGTDLFAAAGGRSTDSVLSLTIETAAGWYAVITQDCDIARSLDIEPCIHVAPVRYVDDAVWEKLNNGQTSYRYFALPPNSLSPPSPASDSIARGRKPIVDLRYVTSVDKAGLQKSPGLKFKHVLSGQHKVRFASWLGSRFARVAYDDTVAEKVLPTIRVVLDSLNRIRATTAPGSRKPAATFIGCVREWYVREAGRGIELMGRFDHTRARAERVLRQEHGAPKVNTTTLDAGAKAMQQLIIARLDSATGYAIAVTWRNFDDLPTSQFETYSLWVTPDDPEASFTN